MKNTKGFTLIELLIVIAVLGILIVAILSAIDPLEQIRKARDAGRKSDAAELLSAYERYFSTFQCYPWDSGAPNCSTITDSSRPGPSRPNFDTDWSGTGDTELLTQGEIKPQFADRGTVSNSELWMGENVDRQITVCFEPESKSGRSGGYGDITCELPGISSTVLDCGTQGYQGGNDTTENCWVCLPQ